MKITIGIANFFIVLFLAGCNDNENLTPPPNSPLVQFSIDIPDNINFSSAKVMYRSTECQAKKPTADGGEYFVPGYHYVEKKFLPKERDGMYHLSIPKDGGGKCEWALSNVTIDIQYKLNAFKSNVDDSAGTGFIVVFDKNLPQRYDGIMKERKGDFTIDVDLYPWLNESFIPKHTHRLWLYGNNLYYTYKATNTNKIIVRPVIHSNLITHSQGPKVKVEGQANFSVYKYPDGSIDLHGDSSPDFERLQSIKNKLTP